METRISRKRRMIIVTSCGVMVIILFFALAKLLFNGNEQHTSTIAKEQSTSGLICTAGVIDGAFFDNEGASLFEQEIRISFVEQEAHDISYRLNAEYPSAETAEKAKERLHAYYNIQMGKKAESFTPTFVNSQNSVRINIFANNKNLTEAASNVFFLDEKMTREIFSLSRKEIASFYESSGFICKDVN